MTTSLILLTYDELEGSRALFPHLPLSDFDEVLVVDGGSRDGTREFYQERGIRVVGQERKGRGEAFRVGARETRGDVLVYFSPDGNEDPADLLPLVGCIRAGADLAIASRFARGARNEEDDQLFRPRAWVNMAFTLVANLLFCRGRYVSDTINGYRAIRRSAFQALRTDERGFPIEYQMSIRAMKARLRIDEIPTREGDRIGGASKAHSFPVGVGHLKVLIRELIRPRPR